MLRPDAAGEPAERRHQAALVEIGREEVLAGARGGVERLVERGDDAVRRGPGVGVAGAGGGGPGLRPGPADRLLHGVLHPLGHPHPLGQLALLEHAGELAEPPLALAELFHHRPPLGHVPEADQRRRPVVPAAGRPPQLGGAGGLVGRAGPVDPDLDRPGLGPSSSAGASGIPKGSPSSSSTLRPSNRAAAGLACRMSPASSRTSMPSAFALTN